MGCAFFLLVSKLHTTCLNVTCSCVINQARACLACTAACLKQPADKADLRAQAAIHEELSDEDDCEGSKGGSASVSQCVHICHSMMSTTAGPTLLQNTHSRTESLVSSHQSCIAKMFLCLSCFSSLISENTRSRVSCCALAHAKFKSVTCTC